MYRKHLAQGLAQTKALAVPSGLGRYLAGVPVPSQPWMTHQYSKANHHT
jgi:hypothetical protein